MGNIFGTLLASIFVDTTVIGAAPHYRLYFNSYSKKAHVR